LPRPGCTPAADDPLDDLKRIGIGLGHLAPGAFHAIAAVEATQINLSVSASSE
jgi:hypothetical protein